MFDKAHARILTAGRALAQLHELVLATHPVNIERNQVNEAETRG
jgi:hypothetical protein